MTQRVPADAAPWKTVRTVALWTLGYGGLHSVFASRVIKDRVRRRFGVDAFNGVYRICFNAQALISFGGLLMRFQRLPDRQLYQVHRPWSLLMRLVQLGAICMLIDANVRIGVGRMTGFQGLWEWLRGQRPLSQNPAQGPQLEGNLSRRTGGAFQISRHPNNLGPFLLWICQPRMTVRFLTFTLAGLVYLVLGSIHEEWRLRAAYGKAYDRYRDGTPFYLPWPPR